jgi:hypothetical protein
MFFAQLDSVPAPMIAQVRLWALPLFCGRAAHLPTA